MSQSSQSLLDNHKFWKVARHLINLDRKVKFEEVLEELSLSASELNSYISFLKDVDYELELSKTKEGRFIAPGSRPRKVALKFDLFEWLQFQACFPKISECEGKPFYQEVKTLLCKAEEENTHHDFFEPASKLESVLAAEESLLSLAEVGAPHGMPGFLEEAVNDEASLKLICSNGKSLKIFPRKVVFIEGELSLVGESISEGCLVSISVAEILNAAEEEKAWQKIFSSKEIEDFVSSLRSLNENEIRLVLKICSQANFNANLKRQVFANQCMVTNPQGDFIWAASIEPSDEIFEWLESLGADVEILDPMGFKKDFLKYCEAKLKKLA